MIILAELIFSKAEYYLMSNPRIVNVYVDFVDVIDADTVRAARSHELSEMVRERMAAAEGLPRVPEIRRTFKYGNN